MLPEENRCLDLLGRIATDHVLVENLGDFLQSLALLTDLRSGFAQRFEDSRSCFSLAMSCVLLLKSYGGFCRNESQGKHLKLQPR